MRIWTHPHKNWKNWKDTKVNFNPVTLFREIPIDDYEWVKAVANKPEWLPLSYTPELLIEYLKEYPDQIKSIRKALAMKGMLDILKESDLPWRDEDLQKLEEPA